MMNDHPLRQQLINLLLQRQAHMIFEDSVAEFPLQHINTRPPNVSYSFWHLLEHIRICQYDILDYICNPDYQSLNFPDDLWPNPASEADEQGWQTTIDQFYTDRQALVAIVEEPAISARFFVR